MHRGFKAVRKWEDAKGDGLPCADSREEQEPVQWRNSLQGLLQTAHMLVPGERRETSLKSIKDIK